MAAPEVSMRPRGVGLGRGRGWGSPWGPAEGPGTKLAPLGRWAALPGEGQWGSGKFLARRREGEDLGSPKCLLHQEINSLRTGFGDKE